MVGWQPSASIREASPWRLPLLRPQSIAAVPAETARVARACFPKGHLSLRLADELGTLFSDERFADLSPAYGQPAFAPWRRARVTIRQFAEDLSDRQAAAAGRRRIDGKYLLRLELGDPGFDASVLCEFRSRLVAGEAETRLLETLLTWSREHKLLKARGKQRTDSPHVLAAIRGRHRLEVVAASLRHALNRLTVVAPEWVRSVRPPAWGERYGQRAGHDPLPTSEAGRTARALQIGQDGRTLLEALWAPAAPARRRALPAADVLRRVWVQNYLVDAEGLRRRTEADGLPPSLRFLNSPDDPEASFARKTTTPWVGYKVHRTETCEEDLPELSTNVETPPAPLADGEATPRIHDHLNANDLLPGVPIADTGDLDAQLRVETHKDDNVDLLGPTRPDYRWQARANAGFAAKDFRIAWDKEQATCPAGRTSHRWTPAVDKRQNDVIKIKFSRKDCARCAFRPQCFQSKRRSGRRALTVRPREQFAALQSARQRERTEGFATLDDKRAGIEGTLSRGIRTCGLRRTRYIGLARTHIGHILTAVALNFLRLGEWFAELPRPKTRVSPFVRLMNQPSLA